MTNLIQAQQENSATKYFLAIFRGAIIGAAYGATLSFAIVLWNPTLGSIVPVLGISIGLLAGTGIAIWAVYQAERAREHESKVRILGA